MALSGGARTPKSLQYLAKLISFVLTTFLTQTLVSCSGDDTATSLVIPSLGRTANLGYLYDERTSQFRNVQLFKHTRFPPGTLASMQKPGPSINSEITDTLADKFKLFGMDPSTTVDFLAGSIKVDGASRCLKAEDEREVTQGILLYKYQTVVEDLQAFSDDLSGLYNRYILNHKSATHFISGVTWGASVAIKFKSTTSAAASGQQELNDALGNEFEMIQETLEGSGDESRISKFSMVAHSDILLPISNLTTHGHVKNICTGVPALLQSINGGKGIPLEYSLTPLSAIRSHLNVTSPHGNIFAHALNQWTCKKFVGIFDKLSLLEKQINQLHKKLHSNENCLLSNARQRIVEFRANFQNSKMQLTNQLQDTLFKVRSGNSSSADLANLANQYNVQNFSQLQEFDEAVKKIEFCHWLEASHANVNYLGARAHLNELQISQNFGKIMYVMFTKSEFTKDEPVTYQENLNTFLHKLDKPFNRLFFVDCDFEFQDFDCRSVNQTTIKQFKNGELTIDDVNLELKTAKSLELEPMEIQAIGRFAQIGELYDARTDTFLRRSIISAGYSSDLIHVTSPPFHTEEFMDVPSQEIGDKFKELNVEPELQFSILAQMFPLSNSGQYFSRLHQTSRKRSSPTRSFLHKQRLTTKELRLRHPEFTNCISADFINSNEIGQVSPTHFVTRIEYGFNSIFSVQMKQNSNSSQTDTDLSPILQNLKASVISKISTNNLRNGTDQSDAEFLTADLQAFEVDWNFIIELFTDIPEVGPTPVRIDSPEKLSRFLKQYQLSISMQAPKPLAYILHPIENLKNEIGLITTTNGIQFGVVSATGEDPMVFYTILSNADEARSQMERFRDEMRQHPECTTDEDETVLLGIKSKFDRELGSFNSRFEAVVREIKSGQAPKSDGDTLQKLREEFCFSGQKYFDGGGQYRDLQNMLLYKEKLSLVKKLDDIKFVGRENTKFSYNDIFEEKNEKFTTNKYLMYYKPNWTKQGGNGWSQVSQLFFGPLCSGSGSGSGSKAKNAKCYIIDCSFAHPNCENTTHPVIHEYKDGKLTTTDFIGTQVEVENSFQNLLNGLNSQIENVTRDIESLMMRLDELSSTVQTKQDHTSGELRTIASSISSCENSVSVLTGTVTANRERNNKNIQTLRTTVDDNSNNIASRQRQLENIETELRSAKTTIQQNQAAISSLQGTVTVDKNTHDDNIRALRNGLNSLTNTVVANKEICLSKISPTAPLHRYWNGKIGDHFYTTNWNELGGGRSGWTYEGIQGYIHTSPTN